MFVEEYLDRIGIREIKTPSFEFLSELQQKHMQSIPFEDLDIPDGDNIILDIERIYGKVIKKKRGGFCYELNGLFYSLLKMLGFDPVMIEARVYNAGKKELGPHFDHMAVLVRLENTYLTDVGFGDSFRTPIVFPGGSASDVSGNYKLQTMPGQVHRLMKLNEGEWILQYEFSERPRRLEDFTEMCDYQQFNPESHFRQRNICTIATEDGRITLSENSLTITTGSAKEKTAVNNQMEFHNLLNKYFGIKLER